MSWVLSLLLKHWLKVAVAGLVLGVLSGAYVTGYRAAWRQAEVDTLKAKIASQQRDIDANRLQRQADQKTIAALEAQAQEDEAQYERLRIEAAKAGRVGLTQSELDLLLGKRK